MNVMLTLSVPIPSEATSANAKPDSAAMAIHVRRLTSATTAATSAALLHTVPTTKAATTAPAQLVTSAMVATVRLKTNALPTPVQPGPNASTCSAPSPASVPKE